MCKTLPTDLYLIHVYSFFQSDYKVVISFIHKMFPQEEVSLKCQTVHILIVFIFLIKITTCGSETIIVRVREVAHLNFDYPCSSSKVTLQYSHRAPFYSSTNPSKLPLPPNYALKKKYDIASDKCSLHLTISPVLLADSGTYILTAYRDGAMLPDYPRIWLHVDYPPGKTSCKLGNDYVDGEWTKLQCSAPEGSLQGQIMCFQNGKRLPPLHRPTESGEMLNQVILARMTENVYCCSSLLEETRHICECKDWGWDPMHKNVLTNIIDPCPASSSSSQSPISSQELSTLLLSTTHQTNIQSRIKDNTKTQMDSVSSSTQINKILNIVSVVLIVIVALVLVLLRYFLTVIRENRLTTGTQTSVLNTPEKGKRENAV